MKQIILNYEFAVIFIVCFVAFLLVSIFIKKQIIKKISMLLFSMFFVLFLFELILSFFMPVLRADFHKQYLNTIKENNIINKRYVKLISNNRVCDFFDCNNINFNKFKDYELILDSRYSLYTNEFRFVQCNKDSNETYLFFGCSFVFGLGLNDNETLPYYFSQLYEFKKNVVNCGVSGQSTNTALNILNNEIFSSLINKKSKIKHCFYSLINDHIDRNFRYESESLCIDGYLYKNKEWYIPTTIGKIKYVFMRSYIFRKVFLTIIDECLENYYEKYMINTLIEMNRIVEEKYNSKLTIIVWPDYDKHIFKLKETNLDLIILPEYFNLEENGYRIKYDEHPTAKANKEIAEILYNHIN